MTEIHEAPTHVLPRELTEVSDAVRAVGTPPTPALADPYRFRVVDPEADAEFVSEWMNRPNLVEASIFELEPRCRRIMFDPDHRNSGARRLCEFAGCDFLGEHDMSNRRMALYALRRESIISA